MDVERYEEVRDIQMIARARDFFIFVTTSRPLCTDLSYAIRKSL
jgi:hypothetical protein